MIFTCNVTNFRVMRFDLGTRAPSTRLFLLVLALTVAGTLFYWFTTVKRSSSKVKYTTHPQTHCLEYSPAYPSAGGPGCSPKCKSSGKTRNSSYGAVYLSRYNKWPMELRNNMHLAGEILKKYGPLNSLDTERKIYLHVAVDYFCCYSPDEGTRIGDFIKSYEWESQEVSFDRLVCAIHSTKGMVSLVLLLDADSQARMLKYVLGMESKFEQTTGIKKHIPHTKLQEFHMTLATVNQTLFSVQPALEEINRTIPPGTWSSKPVVLHKPVCRKCGKS